MINTILLSSSLLSAMNQLEVSCKAYNPDTDNLATFQQNIKQTYASLLANAHTAHVLTATVQGSAMVATVPSTAPVIGVLT